MFHNSVPDPRSHQSIPEPLYHSEQSYYQNLQPPVSASGQELPVDQRSSGSAVRRRTSRACDQCNQLRTRCDGKLPCKHCVESQLSCKYARLPKKRGKLSKKELAEKEAAESRRHPRSQDPTPAQAQAFQNGGIVAPQPPMSVQSPSGAWDEGVLRRGNTGLDPMHDLSPNYTPQEGSTSTTAHGQINQQSAGAGPTAPMSQHFGTEQLRNFRILSTDSDTQAQTADTESRVNRRANAFHRAETSTSAGVAAHEMSYSYNPEVSSLNTDFGLPPDMDFLMEGNSLVDFESSQKSHSPGTGSGAPSVAAGASKSRLKYPVLVPLVPHIKNMLPASLACELLEHYFSSSSTSCPRPASPYLLGFVFSRQSFLTTQNPRPCSPALLASMLWIATQTSDAKLLTTPASARDRLSQKLFNLTIALLRPLIHGSLVGKSWRELDPSHHRSSVSGAPKDSMDSNLSPTATQGTLDDVATYIHIAIVSSAGESKGGSLRWWHAAWNLSKELKLGQEVTESLDNDDFTEEDANPSGGLHHPQAEDEKSRPTTEEVREERRRVWWLLYMVDRHLGLCYNRPIMLLDRECQFLQRPMDELSWYTGNFNNDNHGPSFSPNTIEYRLEFTGPSIFGYFLPLMTILGGLVDLQNARRHPLVIYGLANIEWDSTLSQAINVQLEIFERSMRAFESQHLPAGHESRTEADQGAEGLGNSLTEAQLHVKMAASYSTHVLHVLHILVTGKWDPIHILDDEDNWISSRSFLGAIHHAVAGAEAVKDILHYDPEINFMPFLYGIYLLQGSFLLLLIADKLHGNNIPDVVNACETIVRAHEACVVTLSTEYQRAFRKVMQSALAQARGRTADSDAAEQQRRRRHTLELFRWTSEGTGLAM